MNEDYKIYHLSVQGIDKEMFSNSFYDNKCEKINFNGVIKEQKIKTQQGEDFISLAPKFKPHSDYEMMLQSTDTVVKSPITSLTDEAIKYIFGVGYDYISFLSDNEIIKKYGLENGYPYLVFNYDEFTTDRHSGMSKKPFHLHLNSWKKESIDRINEIDKKSVSPYYYQSVVDPIFDISQILARDALRCNELNKYLEEVKVFCGEQEISYSSVYKVKGGWKTLLSDDFPQILKTIHRKLEERYIFILKCFSGKISIPELYTRHLLLPDNVIKQNIESCLVNDSTKQALLSLMTKVNSITPEQFKKLCEDTDLRDSLIPLRWLAYSIGLFSNSCLTFDKKQTEKELYMNVTPRLFTKIGGASIMNFPEHSLVKIDRGMGNIDSETFKEHVEFQKDFTRELKKKRW